MRKSIASLAAFAAIFGVQPVSAQQIENGVTIQRSWFNSRTAIEPIQVKNTNGDQIRGMQRVAVSVFNVAFPDTFDLKVDSNGTSGSLSYGSGMMISHRSSELHTNLVGMDLATRQRITDAAYADFVNELKAAGFEVVDQAALIAAAPEINTWESLPSGTQGRFGTYVAPTGMSVHMMPGDTAAKRATSGMFGALNMQMNLASTTQAYKRSAYVARDANTYVLAVSMVVDYAVYSSSGDRRGFGKRVSVDFEEGANVAAGSLSNPATVVRVWNTHSGGFPTFLTLQQPVVSSADIGPYSGSAGTYSVKTNPSLFTPPATDVILRANGAMVDLLAQKQTEAK
jgi:hypothetical protein